MILDKNWRKPFGPNEVIQRIRPEYTKSPLNNPHKGTTTFQRFEGDPLYKDLSWNDREGPQWFKPARKKIVPVHLYPATRISYCRWAWEDLEPQEGKIRFDIIEGALKAAADRNQTLQIRTQPFVGGNGPKWLWDKGIKENTSPGKKRKYAIWDDNDPLYFKYWSKHIRALGKKFDGHPALESVDLSLAGPCGETGGNATDELANQIVDTYCNAFKKTPLISLLNKNTGQHIQTKKNHTIGWRQDCFGDLRGDIYKLGGVPEHLCYRHMYDVYPKKIETSGVKDLWKTAPVTMETCWTPAFWFNQGWDLDWIIEAGYKYHMSVFMPKSVYIPSEWMGKIEEFSEKIGYRFHLLQMIMPMQSKPAKKIDIEATIDNKGVAPIYHPYRFALKFTQNSNEYIVHFKADIRKWLPDYSYFKESITIPKELKKGFAKVSCAIVNSQNQAVVKLALKDIDKNNWHPLTCIDIV